MKKTLLYLFLCLCSSAFSQLLQSDNFNALTVGNVGTDITGVTVGQGGWSTFSNNGASPTTSTNAGNANFQIVATGNSSSNGALFQGPNGDKGVRFMWKDGLSAAWTGRTSGNNRIEVEFDLFTGTTSTSRNEFGAILYTTDVAVVGIIYNAETRVLRGQARLSNNGTIDYFNISFAAAPGLVLPENTWVRLAFGYNTLNGQPYWKVNGDTATRTINETATLLWVNNLVPAEVDFVSFSGSSTTVFNTLSTDRTFDNFVVRASASDALLSSQSNSITDNNFSIYPNPTSSILNISNPNNIEIKNISVVDINGRIVKNQSDSLSQINVSDLNSGVYFVTIEAAEGKTTKKFIKQ